MEKIALLLGLGLALIGGHAYAQEFDPTIDPSTLPPDESYFARVEEVKQEGLTDRNTPLQIVTLRFLSGPQKGQSMELKHGDFIDIGEEQKVRKGEKVLVTKSETVYGTRYLIGDKDRITPLLWMLLIFFGLTIWLSKWKGVGSILGLAATIAILVFYMVPRIANGENPIIITILGSLIIISTSLFLAHGFLKRTVIAFAGTLATLLISLGLAWVFTEWAKIFGTGTEDAFLLQLSGGAKFNLQGLFLSGVIIGTLGVLDDITTSQAAAVDEIRRANPDLSSLELYKRGLSVGREHIASLVNTLVLAYAGTSLPLLLAFSIYKSQPFITILNSEFMMEEIVRTLVGSLALMLAVPITTILAARILPKWHDSDSTAHTHTHH